MLLNFLFRNNDCSSVTISEGLCVKKISDYYNYYHYYYFFFLLKLVLQFKDEIEPMYFVVAVVIALMNVVPR